MLCVFAVSDFGPELEQKKKKKREPTTEKEASLPPSATPRSFPTTCSRGLLLNRLNRYPPTNDGSNNKPRWKRNGRANKKKRPNWFWIGRVLKCSVRVCLNQKERVFGKDDDDDATARQVLLSRRKKEVRGTTR